MRRHLAGFVALLLAILAPLAHAAEGLPEAVTIEADELVFEEQRDLYEASGNVRVVQRDGATLTADWLAINATTQVGVAVGDVILRDGDDVVRAEFVAVNLETLEALATQAELDSPMGFAMTGDTIERSGVNTYSFESGVFTTCRCPPKVGRRPWEVEVGDADIHVGGYAVARDVTFRVLDFPVFYTPWLILPVKTERQSGFLIPEVGSSSRGGTEVELPFFWAARENLNILLRPRYYSKRGMKYGVEFDYLFGEQGESSGGFAILPGDDEVDRTDGAGDPGLNTATEQFSDNRYAYWLRHEHPLARGIRYGTDINRISDNNYPLDFEDLEEEARHARFLESKGWASYGRGSTFLGTEISYNDDLQSPNDLDRDQFLLHRLPDVLVASVPRQWGPIPIEAGMDVRYTYFYQKADEDDVRGNLPVSEQFFDTGIDGIFSSVVPPFLPPAPPFPEEPGFISGTLDDPDQDNFPNRNFTELDGFFQEGELLADFGHRADVYPTLALPLRFGPLETTTEAGYRGTFYGPENGDSESRSLFTGRFDAQIPLAKELILGGRSLNHLLVPQVSFGYITDDDDQHENPLFIPDPAVRPNRIINEDIRVLLRNPSDRISEERLLIGALENRFFAPPSTGGSAPRLIAEARIGGGYDFYRSHASNVYLSGGFHPNENLSFIGLWGYDPHAETPQEAEGEVRWRSEPQYTLKSSLSDRRHEFTLTYRYLHEVPRMFEAFRRDDDVFDDFSEEFDRINQLSATANVALFRQLDVFGSGYISLEDSDTTEGTIGVAFLSSCACWELIGSIQRRNRPDDTRFTIEIRLAGLGFQPITRPPEFIRDRDSVDDPGEVWDSPAP